ncbi:MAG: hypothetical protein QOI58_791 [Thermoanaerobaculia bacterium]|jgi:hypothetical protein|nr:hypothetical protein [Thermoanaerobaculia bacterium]
MMRKIANHTALKEWASVIEALGRGEQIVLIRKGGLADESFGVEAQRFYLFPTNYHDAGSTEPSHVRITHWAEAVKTWQIKDAAMLPSLEALTILDDAAIETRYRFRPDQAINVIAVRAYRLVNPVDVVMKSEYSGCRSWVSVDEEIDIDGSVAALSEEALDAQINAIDITLTEPVAAWN